MAARRYDREDLRKALFELDLANHWQAIVGKLEIATEPVNEDVEQAREMRAETVSDGQPNANSYQYQPTADGWPAIQYSDQFLSNLNRRLWDAPDQDPFARCEKQATPFENVMKLISSLLQCAQAVLRNDIGAQTLLTEAIADWTTQIPQLVKENHTTKCMNGGCFIHEREKRAQLTELEQQVRECQEQLQAETEQRQLLEGKLCDAERKTQVLARSFEETMQDRAKLAVSHWQITRKLEEVQESMNRAKWDRAVKEANELSLKEFADVGQVKDYTDA